MPDAALVDRPHGFAPAAERIPGSRAEAASAWALSLPSIVAFTAVILLPTLAAVALAFTDYELGASTIGWVGLENFRELFSDRGFGQSVRNTLLYVALVTPASLFGGLFLALLIEGGTRGRAFFRAVFFLPVVSLTVAMASAWQYLLHPTIGPLNAVLRSLGVEGPAWLSSSDTVLLSLAAINTWENLGFNMVLFLAGLTAIPRELYAAAGVDGVQSAWERFRLVTWPLLGPTTLFVLTITMIRALSHSFDLAAVLTQGGPNKASEVLLFTLYQEGFTYFRLGYAAAITLVFLVAVVTVMTIQTRFLDKRVHYV